MFKVRLFQDNTYEVYVTDDGSGYGRSYFQGSLADCEAWIRLRESGRM